jgi:hypothetical protein
VRSAIVPRNARTIGEPAFLATATMRRICSSAVPCLGSNAREVGHTERMPTSSWIPSRSAYSRTFRTCASSRLPRNRISEKCTTRAFHFAQ